MPYLAPTLDRSVKMTGQDPSRSRAGMSARLVHGERAWSNVGQTNGRTSGGGGNDLPGVTRHVGGHRRGLAVVLLAACNPFPVNATTASGGDGFAYATPSALRYTGTANANLEVEVTSATAAQLLVVSQSYQWSTFANATTAWDDGASLGWVYLGGLTPGATFSLHFRSVGQPGPFKYQVEAVDGHGNVVGDLATTVGADCDAGTFTSGANLSGADLDGKDLSYCNLSGDNLTGADLAETNLTGANLSGATLTGATFLSTWVTGVNWTGAVLTGTRLANLNDLSTGIGLATTVRTWQNTQFRQIDPVVISGADLRGLQITDDDLTGVRFEDDDLTGTNFTDTYWGSFEGSNLTDTNFAGVTGRLDFAGADLQGMNATSATFAGDFSGATDIDSTIGLLGAVTNASYLGSKFTGTSWDLAGRDLEGLNFSGAVMTSIDLANSDLRHADLAGADLADTDVAGADLSGAILDRAYLPDLWFDATKLAGAALANVDMSGARFTNADLTGATGMSTVTLDVAVTWSATICPDATNSDADGGSCIGHF